MMSIKELKIALNNKSVLMWNDPCFIDGNDYTITFIEDLDECNFDELEPILIHYGGGSEAQVFLHEIIYKPNQIT